MHLEDLLEADGIMQSDGAAGHRFQHLPSQGGVSCLLNLLV